LYHHRKLEKEIRLVGRQLEETVAYQPQNMVAKNKQVPAERH